ncbi:MAG: DUF1016 family protein [Bacilli bacterium]|nr:DUF1016 family protein [Bacilli bacterium]
MNYYSEIKNRLIENENYARIKDYSKERYKVQTYYEVGKMLSEAGKCYGEGIIKKYSELLSKELNKKYSYRSLIYMLRFCELQKVQSMTANLSWGHWIELLSIKDIEKIKYYVYQIEYNCLTTRELRQRIKNKEYERLDDSTKQKLINKEELTIQEIIKNPIIIHNKNNRIVITEKDLQNIIIENIASFLKELGNKFCFIDNEYKIKIGDSYNYIDLLLYNSEYHCYVVVELKITELKKEYIGQIETYMNYVDKNIKDIIDNKTIGIIICKKDNKFIMEYCSDSRILSRFYEIK